MNTTVNFELAKLLKERGYDQDGFNIAWYNELGRMNGRTDINKDGRTFSEVYPNEESFYGSAIKPEHKKEFKIESFTAPTIADVIMWIYEKHNIWVVVNVGKPHNCGIMMYANVIKFGLHHKCKYKTILYNTPLEAYSDAIQYVLKDLLK